MQIYCEKCRNPPRGTERNCLKCGAPFGGERWVLVVGGILLLGLPAMLAFTGNGAVIFDPKILFWYDLPVLVGTAFLYDYHPKRRALYFWGGAVVILASLWILILAKGQ